MTIIDPSAHMNKIILSAFEKIDFPEFAARRQVRATVMIFPMDEISDMDDIRETVETLGNRVDWLIVRNPARIPTTRFFDGSELEAKLREYGAPISKSPYSCRTRAIISEPMRCNLAGGSLPPKRLRILEIKIDMVHRIILEKWIGDLFRRFDDIAGHLLPDAAAKEVQPVNGAAKHEARMPASINLKNIL